MRCCVWWIALSLVLVAGIVGLSGRFSPAPLAAEPLASVPVPLPAPAAVEQTPLIAEQESRPSTSSPVRTPEREALVRDLGKDAPEILLVGNEMLAEHMFERCVLYHRFQQLFQDIANDPDPRQSALQVFDERLAIHEQWARQIIGVHRTRAPGSTLILHSDHAVATSCGLFLCMEYGTVEDVLSGVDRWKKLAKDIHRELYSNPSSDLALSRLNDGQSGSDFAKQLGANPLLSDELSADDYRTTVGLEGLFLVNVYFRLLLKHGGGAAVFEGRRGLRPRVMEPTQMWMGQDRQIRGPYDLSQTFDVITRWDSMLEHNEERRLQFIAQLRKHVETYRKPDGSN